MNKNKISEETKAEKTKKMNHIKLLAYKQGFSNVDEFLSCFVSDTDGVDEWYNNFFDINNPQSFFRYHLFNYEFTINQMRELAENPEDFQEIYESYLGEQYSKKSQSREECLEVLNQIIKTGVEL